MMNDNGLGGDEVGFARVFTDDEWYFNGDLLCGHTVIYLSSGERTGGGGGVVLLLLLFNGLVQFV